MATNTDRLSVMGWGNYNIDRHPRMGVLLDGLRAHGDHVVEINRPTKATTARRVRALSDPRNILSPIKTLSRSWWTLARRARRARAATHFDAILIGYMGHFDVIVARALFPRATIVLDHLIFAADTARDRGIGSGLLRAGLTVLDRWAVASASVVLVDTDEHQQALPRRAQRRALVVPVGARSTWLAAGHHRPKSRGRLSVVFYGHYTPLQGTATIATAARLLHERGVAIDLTMIGNGQDRAAAQESAGDAPVSWRDWVEPETLPELVAAHDVCLGIFGTSRKARNVVPNKVYQGLAAGCIVVTSDTVPQRRALADVPLYVPPGDAEALARALASLAETTAPARRQRGDASASLAEQRFSPQALVEPLRAALHARRERR